MRPRHCCSCERPLCAPHSADGAEVDFEAKFEAETAEPELVLLYIVLEVLLVEEGVVGVVVEGA